MSDITKQPDPEQPKCCSMCHCEMDEDEARWRNYCEDCREAGDGDLESLLDEAFKANDEPDKPL